MGGDGGNDHGLFAWRTVIATAITTIIGLSGWTLTKISEHSTALGVISTKMDDLTIAVKNHNTEVDAALGRLLDDDTKHSIAIAQDHDAIENLREREPDRRAEAFSPSPSIPVVPEIGAAITHALPWLRARGARHRGMGHGGR